MAVSREVLHLILQLRNSFWIIRCLFCHQICCSRTYPSRITGTSSIQDYG